MLKRVTMWLSRSIEATLFYNGLQKDDREESQWKEIDGIFVISWYRVMLVSCVSVDDTSMVGK